MLILDSSSLKQIRLQELSYTMLLVVLFQLSIFPTFSNFSCIRSLLGFSVTHFNEWQISVEFDKFWTLAIDPIKTFPNFVFVALSVLVSYLIILSSKKLQIKSDPIKMSTGRLSLEYYCLLILDFHEKL